MATLILTTVGTILGGPIGGMIGAVAGQAVDAQLFGPGRREGPRLTDLRLQTSAYGTQVPRIFGRMRVAGSVIWATDLMEHSSTSGGKGQPTVTTYSYSASFAVALSSRPVRSVGRIWADGNLLRGAGGDFKSALAAFRFHGGDPDQPADPLIVADRGADAAPACRGMAYVVFEGLDLSDFGNRIPSLTFELVADDAPVHLGGLCAAMVDGVPLAYVGTDEPVVDGYAASGASAADALSPLIDAYGLLVRDGGGGLEVVQDAGDRPLALARSDDLASANGKALDMREQQRTAVQSVPRKMSLRHYDAGRDYQSGLQSAERQGPGSTESQVDMPAVLAPDTAMRLAAAMLRRQYVGRRTVRLNARWSALALQPGHWLRPEGLGGAWRVEEMEWADMAVHLTLRAVPQSSTDGPVADGGHAVAQIDDPVGPTRLVLVETPQLGDAPVQEPQLFAAACGGGRQWRGALLLKEEGAGDYAVLGRTAGRAVIGTLLSALPPGTPHLFDMAHEIDVLLDDNDAQLAPAGDSALLNGANACMVGEELMQFGTARQIAPGVWRLGRLLRGRRGSEARREGHAAGDGFLLLERGSLFPVTGAGLAPGARIGVAAQGVGDVELPVARRTLDGRAILPLAPVHLAAVGSVGTGFALSWVRRSRLGWAWVDGVDAPLGEEREAYLVSVHAGALLLRSAEVAVPGWSYDPTAVAADSAAAAAAGTPLTISVRQLGMAGPGEAVQLVLSA